MQTNSKYQEFWDKQYLNGEWDLLRSPLEYARFDAVRKSIYDSGKTNLKILEVGCGEGLLQAGISQGTYETYIGIDISNIAIKNANSQTNVNTIYEVADMETYVPQLVFDIIIFNESIYYSPFPIQLLTKYFSFLTVDGLMILSIFNTASNVRLFGEINQIFNLKTLVETQNSRGTWFCGTYIH